MMKYTIFLLMIIVSFSAHSQSSDSCAEIPATWNFKGKVLTPVVDSVGPGKVTVKTYNGDSATGFHALYLGSVVSKDSVTNGMYHGRRNRLDPDVLFRWAAVFPNKCSAKAAFWKMIDQHPKHE